MSVSVGELYGTLELRTGPFNSALRKSSDAVYGFAKVAAGVAVAGLGALSAASISAAQSAMGYLRVSSRIASITGLNITESSKLVAVLQRYGIEGDAAIKTVGMLVKNVGLLTVNWKTSAAFTKQWGFSLRDANGHVLDANQLLLQAADYFNNKNIPATKKAALEAKLFGRSWGDLVPILKLGSQGIKDAAAAAEKLGLVLTPENAAQLAAYGKAGKDMGDAMAALKLKVGILVIPILTALTNLVTARLIPAVSRAVDRVHEWIVSNKPLLDGLRSLFGLLGDLVGYVQGSWLPSIGSVAGMLGRWVEANKPLLDQLRAFASSVITAGIRTIVAGFHALGSEAPKIAAVAAGVLLLLGAIRANPVIAILTGIIAGVGLLRIAWDTNFRGMRDTLEPLIVKARELATALRSKLLSAVTEVATKVRDWVTANEDLIAQFSAFTSSVFIKGLETIVDGIKKLGLTAPAIATLAGAFLLLNLALRLNPSIAALTLLIGAVGLVATAWQEDWGGIRETVDGISNNVLPKFQAAVDWISKNVLPVFGDVVDWITTEILPPLQSIFNTIATVWLPALGKAFAAVQQWISDNWPLIESVVGHVADAVATAFDMIANVIAFASPIIVQIAEVIFPLLGNAAQLLLGTIDTAFAAIEVIWNFLADLADDLFGENGSIPGAVNFMGDVISDVVGIATGVIGGLIDAIKTAIGWLNTIISKTQQFVDTSGKGGGGTFGPLPSIPTPTAPTSGSVYYGGKFLPSFATGTPYFSGGWAMVGEQGPELVRLPPGSSVTAAGETADMLGAGGLTIEHLEINGVGSDVSPSAARGFGQMILDEVANGLQEQGARFGSRPRVNMG